MAKINLTDAGNGFGSRIEDFQSPLFIAWQLNTACNLGCLHCCEEAGHSLPDEMTEKEIFKFCQQIIELKIPYLAISGGEPLLHPEFFNICEFIRAHDISLKVETNGEFINKNIAKKFTDLEFRSVQVSIDGVTPQTHERLRLRGDWKAAIEACRCLVDEGVNTEIVFVPTKFNIHEVEDVIDLAHSMGIYGFYTGKIMRIGRAAINWDVLCPSTQEYQKFFRSLEEKTKQYNGKMKVYYYPYDVIEELKYRLEYPSASLLVIPNGKVKLIGPLPFICGDVRKQHLREIWDNYKSAWKKSEVIEYTKKVIDNPALVSGANNWQEI